jgi:hypothetical protein
MAYEFHYGNQEEVDKLTRVLATTANIFFGERQTLDGDTVINAALNLIGMAINTCPDIEARSRCVAACYDFIDQMTEVDPAQVNQFLNALREMRTKLRDAPVQGSA